MQKSDFMKKCQLDDFLHSVDDVFPVKIDMGADRQKSVRAINKAFTKI